MRRLTRAVFAVPLVLALSGCGPTSSPLPVVLSIDSSGALQVDVPTCNDHRVSSVIVRHRDGRDAGAATFRASDVSGEAMQGWMSFRLDAKEMRVVSTDRPLDEIQSTSFSTNPNLSPEDYFFSASSSGNSVYSYFSLGEVTVTRDSPVLVVGYKTGRTVFETRDITFDEADSILSTYCGLNVWEITLEDFR